MIPIHADSKVHQQITSKPPLREGAREAWLQASIAVGVLLVATAVGSEVGDLEPGALIAHEPPIPLTAAYVNAVTAGIRTNHFSVQSAAARHRSAEFNAASIRTWEDPTFKFGGAVGNPRSETWLLTPSAGAGLAAPTYTATLEAGFDARADGDLIYGLDQKLPLFGKAKRQRTLALAEASAASDRVEATFQDTRRKASQAIFSVALADRAVELGLEDLAWLEALSETMEERYRAGGAGLAEVSRMQNEVAVRRQKSSIEQRQADQYRADLNRLTGRPIPSRWPRLLLPEPWRELRQHDRLLALALRNDPRVLVTRGEADVARARVEATRRARLPDVSLGIEGRQYSGDGTFREGMFTVAMSLPWFNRARYAKDVSRENANLDASQLELRNSEQEVAAEVGLLLRGIEAARREAALYRETILPRSEKTVEAVRSEWSAGRGSLSSLMEARRMFIEARLMEARAIREQWTMLSELALCCGVGDLEALEMIQGPNPATAGKPK